MNDAEVRAAALALVQSSRFAMLGTLGEDGFPHIKAVLKAEDEGLRAIWISTNTSSQHVAQLEADARASVYFEQHDESPWRGVLLVGRMEIRRDRASRERLWEEGCERYYPQGIEDPDYTVLRLVPEWGRYYQFGTKRTFRI